MTARSPARWFDDVSVSHAVSSLEAEIAVNDDEIRAGKSAPVRGDESQKLAWGVLIIALGMLVLLVVGLMLFGKRDPDHQMGVRSIISLTCIFVLLPVGLYFGTKHFYGVKSERALQRYDALEQLTARLPALKFARCAKITGPSVGRIPWLASEIDTVVECDLHGDFRGHRLALLECTYVVDMTLTTLDSSIGGFASTVMSHVQHEHIHRRSLEAVLFLDPERSLPDLFSAGKKQPLNWYFKRQLQKNEIGEVTPLAGDGRWTVTSDSTRWAQGMPLRCEELLRGRPEAIVQVLGGYVVVIPQTWNTNLPKEMPHEAAELAENLAWACDVYESLRGEPVSTPVSRMNAASSPASAPRADAAYPAAAATARTAIELSTAQTERILAPSIPAAPSRKPRSVLQVLLGVAGFLLFGIGGITLLGIMALAAKVRGAPDWPTVDGRVLSAEVKERAGPQYSASIRYQFDAAGQQYEGDKRTLTTTEWLDDRAAVEEVVARYKDQPFKVYYNPRNPSEATLEPRMPDSGVEACVSIFAGLFMVTGMGLMYVGIRRPR